MTDPQTPAKDKANNAPELVLRDGNLRSATWKSEGEYGPLFNTRITKLYRDDDGQPRETATLSAKDLLRVSELARETHQEIVALKRGRHVEREQVPSNERQAEFTESWHDEDKSVADIKREQFKQDRAPSKGTRRPRTRSKP